MSFNLTIIAANLAALPVTGLATGNIGTAMDTGTVYRWSGSAWITQEAAVITSVDRTTTGQALVDIADLSIALEPSMTYEFQATLGVQASTTAGNQYGVQYSAAGASVEAQIIGTLAAAGVRNDRITALNTATPAYVTSGATGGVVIEGTITTGVNAGNLTIRHLKVTSGTSTVFAKSILRVRRIG